ncbi:MAG: PEP-CTERM sorting domain-containing protein [Planctomycetota bacterium]
MRYVSAACAAGMLAAPALGAVSINEIRIDQPSTDNDEYFELFGTAGESLSGLWYIVIGDGATASGTVEAVIDLSGQSLDGSGFFFAAEDADTFGAEADLFSSGLLNFENSDNVTHLLVSGFSGSNGDDLDIDDDGVLDVTPWTNVLDSVSLIETFDAPGSGEWWYSPTTVGPDGTFVPAHVYRETDGTGDWLIGQFDPIGGLDTPGGSNVPAPGALAMLGLAGLAAGRRRRRA